MKKALTLAAKILVHEDGTKAVAEGEGGLQFTMVASVPDTDRSGEVMPSKAWRWSDDPLPKLHWNHKTSTDDPTNVIGKLTRVYRDGDRLMVDGELNDKVPGHTKAAIVAGMMRNGSVDQGSVGFLPHKWTERDGRKVVGKQYYAGPREGRVYDDVELYEFSLTTIPDQARSILTAIRSLDLEDDRPDGSTESETDPETPASEPVSAVKEVAPVSWLDSIFGAPADAAPSREHKDGLAKVRDHAVALKTAIDEVLSAERVDTPAARAANAQGGT